MSQRRYPRARLMTKKVEVLKLRAYLDGGDTGTPTIGYGHTRGVKLGMTCTEEQAELWLDDDMQDAIEIVEHATKGLNLSLSMVEALIVFAINLGPKPFTPGKDFYAALRGDTPLLIPVQMMKYIYWQGKPSRGLGRRRAAEVALFFEDKWPPAKPATVAA